MDLSRFRSMSWDTTSENPHITLGSKYFIYFRDSGQSVFAEVFQQCCLGVNLRAIRNMHVDPSIALNWEIFFEYGKEYPVDIYHANVELYIYVAYWFNCPICMERVAPIAETTLPCSHVFCRSCIKQWIRTHKNCPLCRATLDW